MDLLFGSAQGSGLGQAAELPVASLTLRNPCLSHPVPRCPYEGSPALRNHLNLQLRSDPTIKPAPANVSLLSAPWTLFKVFRGS